MRKVHKLVLAVALVAWSPLSVSAATIALDFEGTTQNGFRFENTFGWSFTVNTPIAVDGLGFFDDFLINGSGIETDREITLWTNTGTPLAQTTITNASTPMASTAADGGWLFNAIAPVILLPGTYVISTNNAESDQFCTTCDWIRFANTATTDPAITYIEARDFPGADTFPTISRPSANAGYFGPNFTFTPASVPEPSTLLLLISGGFGFIANARRRRTQRAQPHS